MKSKNPKIQILKRGILIMLILAMILPSSIYAVEGLTLQASTTFEKLMYGEIGSIVRKIEEHFKSNTTLYIVNENQLRALAEYVNNGNSCQGKQIELLNDIELNSNIDWVPIGNIYSEFSGTFNGNGYAITNLTYKVRENYQTEEGYSNVGLFGVVSKLGKVEKVSVNNSNIIASELDDNKISNVGNIVGTNYGTISACSANKMPLEKEERETGESSNNYIGLIIGKNNADFLKKSDTVDLKAEISLNDEKSSKTNVNLKVFRKEDGDNYTEITNFFDRNDFKSGETIKLEFIIEGYYLYTGLEEGKAIKLSDVTDSEEKEIKASADIYPLVTIGEGEKIAIATPVSSLHEKKDETVPQTTVTYEYIVSSEIEVENGSIVMNFEKNQNNKNLYVYYSTNEENFWTGNKITGNAEYDNLQISLDSKIPAVDVEASIDSLSESNRYAEGTEIIIKVKSSEKIQATVAPEINVSFSKSGLGKYNYQEDDKKGNGVHVDALLDAEGKTTWIYSYIIQNGDEGDLNIKYLSGTIKDLVGNEKDISEIETVKINTIYADTTAPTVTITKINDYNAKYDFNSDGVINNNDKELLSQYIKETTGKSEESKQINEATEQNQEQQEIENIIKLNGDINHDGKINVTDYEIFIKMFDEENSITNQSEISFKILWSEEIQAFDSSNISVLNGKIKSLEKIGETQEFLLKIDTEVEDGNVGNLQIIIEQEAYKDLVGHGNIRTEKVIKIDKKAPILISLEAFGKSDTKINSEIEIIKEFFKDGEKIEIVATFDENVVTEEIPDLILQFSESKNSVKVEGTLDGNKIIYIYTISDGDKGSVSVRSFSGTVLDIAGNETKVTKRELNGNTIIADTIAPILKELKVVSPETDVYKAGNEITIEAIFDEEIYVLEENEIKLIKTQIEVKNEEETEITYTNNAPTLKIKFGDNGEEREAIVEGYGTKEDGSIDRTKIIYTYTIVEEHTETQIQEIDGEEKEVEITYPGDNGKLTVVSYENKENVELSDIAGNIAKLNTKLAGNEITADTIAPKVEKVWAEVKEPTVENTEEYYKAGNIATIYVKFDEEIKPAKDNEKPYILTNNNNVQFDEILEDGKTVKFTYTIKTGDNGYLRVNVPGSQFKDMAGNENVQEYISEDTVKTWNCDDVYADTTAPTVTLNRDTGINQTNQTIIISASFSELIYDLNGNKVVPLSKDKAPKLIYSFGSGENREVSASNVSGSLITYNIEKDPVNDNGTLHYELAKGNLCDRAGNEYYKETSDTTAPELETVNITSDSTYGEYCKKDVNICVTAKFNEEVSNQKIELKIKIGQGKEQTISGNIDNDDRTKIVFNYQVKDGDNGEFAILDVQGNTSDDEKLTDKTYGYVKDGYGNQKNIFNFDEKTITGSAIVDTMKPYIAKVEAKVDDKVIASYTKEDGKDAITEVGKTNASEIEYIVTFSELVNYKNGIQVYNGIINDISNNDSDKDGYYNQVTIKVQSTVEGVQSLIILENAFEDRAGNENNIERFNIVSADFTKPTIRFISEYNGGIYVMPTNIGKVEVRPNVEISEDIAKIEYKWDDGEYTETKNYSTSSDIAIPTKAFTEVGTHTLNIKVIDLAGNVSETSKTYEIKASNIKITLSTEEWTNKDITVTVEFGDGLTDNRKVTFKAESASETVEINAIGTDENENTQYTITENGVVYAEATDKVGNKVFTERTITNIDKEAPTVEIDLNSADLVIGTGKEKATIKTNVAVEDNKVLNSAKFAYIQKDIDISNISELDKAQIAIKLDNEARIENAESTKDETPYYLYVIATDKAGNETIEKAGPFTVSDTNEREKVIEATETTSETKQTIPAEIEASKLIAFEQEGKRFNITFNNFEDEEEYLYIIKGRRITFTNGEDGEINGSWVYINKPTTITVTGIDACGNEVIVTKEVTREMIEGPEFEVYGNPEEWTNQDVKLEVYCSEELSALTVNGKDILANMNETITENGDYKFIATDVYGMTSEKTIKVTKIDKDNPVISKTETSGKTITITAEDATSGVAKYAITDTTEFPVEWSNSNEIKVTHDGSWFAWAIDKAGNYVRTNESITVDTTAPIITFNYTLLTVEAGLPIEANIITNEDAIISYSWDEKSWITSENYITNVRVSKNYDITGKYTLYSKARDKFGNESKVQTIEFTVTKPDTDIIDPQIVFEGLYTTKVDGVHYVKVSSNMTTDDVTNKMDKKSLCNVAPEYKNSTEDGKLKTGTEITLNGDTKYIVIVNGDVNCDGKIDFLGDIITANNYRIGIENLSTIQKLAADIDNDGKVEFISDILSMNNYRIGITSSL